MSLINDALKRATRMRTPAASDPDAPMEAAERPVSVGLPTYFMPALLFVITGACYLLVRGWDANRHLGLYPEPVRVQARGATPAAPPAAPANPVPVAEAPVATEPPKPAPENRRFAINDMAIPTETENPFRLQGIFFRPSKPSAVVNSQTVYVGDTIANGTVKAITRESVTLVVDGQTKVLTLR